MIPRIKARLIDAFTTAVIWFAVLSTANAVGLFLVTIVESR